MKKVVVNRRVRKHTSEIDKLARRARVIVKQDNWRRNRSKEETARRVRKQKIKGIRKRINNATYWSQHSQPNQTRLTGR